MTTALTKEVKRICQIPHRGRRTIVIIAPGDMIGFREERRRKVYWLPIAACFDLAVKAEFQAKRIERMKAKKTKVKRGLK